jgi:rubredoxin
MAKYRCTVCNYIYDEEKEGEKWAGLPEDWVCPDCGVGKDMFEKVDEK